jgi:streptogramin lyase
VRTKAIAILMAVVCAAMLLFMKAGELRAQSTSALTGVVSSAEEGPMEGVIVSAKAPASTITISVVTDNRGRYTFPAAKLPPANYDLKIRAVGYDLTAPASASVASGTTASADLKLRKVPDIALQLTDAEWVASMPGTDEQKKMLINCNSCHSLQRVVYSTWSAQEFAAIIPRMNTYVNQSTAVHPQKRMAAGGYINADTIKALADYLATVNLHGRSYWSYPLKGFPRPTGAATHVVYTEYALPRDTIEPHDVYLQGGRVWYSDFGEQFLGALDPVTGKVSEYRIPEMKAGYPTGELDLEPDKSGTLWLSGMYQGGLEAFDPKTSTFTAYPLPASMNSTGAQQSMVMPNNSNVDGFVWTNNQDQRQILRLNVKTGTYDAQGPLKDPTAPDHIIGSYGLLSDSHNNAILLDYGGAGLAKLDSKTGAITMYPTPTLHSAPRRGRVYGNDQVVFAEYGGDHVGTLDTHSGVVKEYATPPGTNPYDAFADKNGEIWEGSMWTDRVLRINPKTNVTTAYLLPHFTNIRRVFVDNSTTPVTFWVGNNHAASIVKLEPQN